jgi:hypothetical protein
MLQFSPYFLSLTFRIDGGWRAERESVQQATETDRLMHVTVDAHNRPKLFCLRMCRSLYLHGTFDGKFSDSGLDCWVLNATDYEEGLSDEQFWAKQLMEQSENPFRVRFFLISQQPRALELNLPWC